MYTEKYISYVMRRLKLYLAKNLDDSISSTISNLAGTTSDRLVVYHRRTAAGGLGDANVWTLYFSVDPATGDLVAYLDAEDNDLLRSSVIKRFKLSVSEESLDAALQAATAFVEEFYSSPDMLYKYIDMIVGEYNEDELEDLSNELDKRDAWESSANWSNRKQKELDQFRNELKKTAKLYAYRKKELMDLKSQLEAANNDEIMAANGEFDAEGQEFDVEYIERQIERVKQDMAGLKRSYLLMQDTIEDYEIEKAKYEKSLSKYKLDREKAEDAAKALTAVEAEPKTEEEKAAIQSRARQTLAALRKPFRTKVTKFDDAGNPINTRKRIRTKKLGDFTDDNAAKDKKVKKTARTAAKKLDLSNI